MIKETDSHIGILGYGQIGIALARFYNQPKVKDLERDDGFRDVEILHVCIPWSDKFVEIVKQQIKEIQPKLVIIHSSVAPGTTKEIGSIAVHSPVRGVHPHLFEGMQTFVKYIGADEEEMGKLAQEHFESIGIQTELLSPSVVTEIGKLLDTTYYGLCIAWHGEMKEICDQLGVDFEEAVSNFNKTYNEGYQKLGMKNVVRPVLYPPEGSIGGTCVIPNAKILAERYTSYALDLLLKYQAKKQD